MSRKVFLRFLTIASLTAMAVALAGFALAGRDDTGAGQAAMIGCLIALVGSVAGALPVLLARERPQADRLPAIFVAMAVRLGAVVVLALAAVAIARLPMRPFLVWVGVAHAALLVPDSWLAIRLVAGEAGESNRTHQR